MKAIGAALLCVLLAAAAVERQETARFEAAGHATVTGVPGLEVVSVRDAAANSCYTLFVLRPAALPIAPPRGGSASIRDAATERDRRLAALAADFERGMPGAVPGTLGTDPLRYQWEGDKVQSEYERLVREEEFGRLARQLTEIAAQPQLAVAGPGPCGR